MALRRSLVSLHSTPQWVSALYVALRGTPSVDALRGTAATSNDKAPDRDGAILGCVHAILDAHVPVQQGEVIDPNGLAVVRRCRWALLPYASPEVRAQGLESFLTRYLSAANSQSFDFYAPKQSHAAKASPGEDGGASPRVGSLDAPTDYASLDEGAKRCIVEAIEAFGEASVLRIPLTAAHYHPFLSFPGLVHLDPDITEDLLVEYETRHRPSSVGDHSLRCIAATSYARAGFPQRAVAIARPEDLPSVVDRTVAGHRAGWFAAMELATCIQEATAALTTAVPFVSRSSTTLAPLVAVCTALDWANRANPSATYFNAMLPPITTAVMLWASSQSKRGPVDLTEQTQHIDSLVAKLSRAAHPSAHWQEVSLVFQEYLKGAAAQGGGQSREAESSTTPTGRVMHVLLLADRWREALTLFDQTPPSVRNAHVSSLNYYLTAVGKQLAASADAVLPPGVDNVPTSRLAEIALVDVAERDVAVLTSLYTSQKPSNNFTHVAYLRALTGCTHLVGTGSTEAMAALWALQGSRDFVRLMEDVAVHCAFGGSWQAAVSLVSHGGIAQRSRYVGSIALAACAQHHHQHQCLSVLRSICRASTGVSMKQVALWSAVVVASRIAITSRATFTDCVHDIQKALQSHGLLREQSDYDAFASQFLEYLSSAVLHRSRAVDMSLVESSAAGGVSREKERTYRAHCIAVVRRRHHDSITNPTKLLHNVIALLEVPPHWSNIAAIAALRASYTNKADTYSGTMRVGWVEALGILQAASQRASSAQPWSTAAVPTLLMDRGFHQHVVMACL